MRTQHKCFMADSRLLICEVAFDEETRPFSGATMYVRLEDVSWADAPATVVAEQVVHNVSYQPGDKRRVVVNLRGKVLDKGSRYAVYVHVDIDGDRQITPGDYVSTQSYPVLTFGHPDRVTVRVRKVA